jgi:hypothetical protein
MINDFTEIGDIILNNKIFSTHFTCDLEKCKGACCTMQSEYGAPVIDKEIEVIEEVLEQVKEILPPKSRKIIEKEGFWEEKEGQLLLSSVEKRDCVFVVYDNDIAKCAFEKLYFQEKIDFRKPISCHLFPIRVSEFGGPVLRFEKYRDCEPALIKGRETNTSVAEFCSEALLRAFGQSFVDKLLKEKIEL